MAAVATATLTSCGSKESKVETTDFVEDVKKAFPGANVTKGFSIYGHEVRTNKAKVEKWLQGLGY